jgi:AcrR family transcriptional regulator
MTNKQSQAESSDHVDLRRVNGEETRQRILDVAQELFARHGYNGVSLREITRRAKVNIASVHYHLGSKEHLLLEVLRRGAAPLVEKRDSVLRRLPKPHQLEDIIRAFVGPVFGEPSAKHILFGELRARLVFENNKLVDRMLSELFDESTRHFVEAISDCLPKLPRKDLFFRMHYLLGVMAYTMSGSKRAKALSDGTYDPTESHEALDQLVAFVAAGFRAPPHTKKSNKVGREATSNNRRVDSEIHAGRGRRPKSLSTVEAPPRSSRRRKGRKAKVAYSE